ncbi:MAG TPA: hypothetical protein VH142_27675 [Polyangiaceae bacterium]|jgi:stalled ribosome rescue protein Dom34|nr:hypothetical protein [Polyangiaceae bacterium]
MLKHIAIWIDHREAQVFHIDRDTVQEATVLAPPRIHHKHETAIAAAHEHPDDEKRFFHDVVSKLEGTEEILVVGPATAKLEFIRYLHKSAPLVEPRIVGVETVDHPTDGQLVAYAKKYFVKTDRMR